MSQNSKFSYSKVRLPAGFKAKRAKEHFHGQRWSNLLYLLPLGLILVLGLWSIFSLCGGNSVRERELPDTCKEKAWSLLKHFNVSESQFHALASFFFHSDQVLFLELSHYLILLSLPRCFQSRAFNFPQDKSTARDDNGYMR